MFSTVVLSSADIIQNLFQLSFPPSAQWLLQIKVYVHHLCFRPGVQLHILQMNSDVCLSHYSCLAALNQGKAGIYSKKTAVEVGYKESTRAGKTYCFLRANVARRGSSGLAGAWQHALQASHPDGKLEGSPSRVEAPPAHWPQIKAKWSQRILGRPKTGIGRPGGLFMWLLCSAAALNSQSAAPQPIHHRHKNTLF